MANDLKAPTSSSTRWAYRQITATPVDKLMEAIEREGEDGWELVCVTCEEPYYRAFLKRPAGAA